MLKTFNLAALIAVASALQLTADKSDKNEKESVFFDIEEKPVIKPGKNSLAQLWAVSD